MGPRFTARDRGPGECDRPPHAASARFATILPAPLLPWFGGALVMGTLAGLPPAETALALAVVFVVRPSAAGSRCSAAGCASSSGRRSPSLGIRGPGGVFSIAHGQDHAAFAALDAVWRLAAPTVLAPSGVHALGRPRVGAG